MNLDERGRDEAPAQACAVWKRLATGVSTEWSLCGLFGGCFEDYIGSDFLKQYN